MKITIFNGSPKGIKGNTQVVIDAFVAGAESAGAQTECIQLSKKEIGHCLGCLNCWTKTVGVCVKKDDMKELIDKYVASDIVVMATPVYCDNISGLTKVFMDRLIPLVDPHFESDGLGETRHVKSEMKLPGIVVISTCGFPEQSHFQVISLLMKRISRNMQAEFVAEIYRCQGNLLTIPNDMLTPIINNYKKIVEKAGREIVQTGGVSKETTEELDKPLIPKEMYIDGANRHWDSARAKYQKRNDC